MNKILERFMLWSFKSAIDRAVKEMIKEDEAFIKSNAEGTEFHKRGASMKIIDIMIDPSIHHFTKQIIRRALEIDPVDAIGDIELALEALKEKFTDNFGEDGGNDNTTVKPNNP